MTTSLRIFFFGGLTAYRGLINWLSPWIFIPSLIVTPERGLWAIDGLLTGLHEPSSSHLDVLRAASGDELLADSYSAALRHAYRWHEFGDSHLILGVQTERNSQ